MIQLEKDQDRRDARDVVTLVDHSIDRQDLKDLEDVITSLEDMDSEDLDQEEWEDLVDADHLDQRMPDQKDAEEVIILVVIANRLELRDHDQRTSEAVTVDHHHSDQKDSRMRHHTSDQNLVDTTDLEVTMDLEDIIVDLDIVIMDSVIIMALEDITDLVDIIIASEVDLEQTVEDSEVSVADSEDVDHAK